LNWPEFTECQSLDGAEARSTGGQYLALSKGLQSCSYRELAS